MTRCHVTSLPSKEDSTWLPEILITAGQADPRPVRRIARQLTERREEAGNATGDPKEAEAVAHRLAEYDLNFLDAPVSGGRPGAIARTLTCFVGVPTSGGFWLWPFTKDGRELKVRPEGQLAFNTITLAVDTALAGLGLAYLPEDVVREDLAKGLLVEVLASWSTPMSGYHLYYPSRRQPTPAFTLLVDALRYATETVYQCAASSQFCSGVM